MSLMTTRLLLPYPDGNDGPDGANVPYWMERLAVVLDEKVLGYDQGPLSGRPAAGVEGRMWYAVDEGTLYYDTGTGWVPTRDQPGDIIFTARSETRRLGYLPCDGAAVSRTTYAAMFREIGLFHGAGNGSTTFNVPDLRDRTAVGAGPTHRLGERFGAATVRLAEANLPAHTHALTDPGHDHGVTDPGHSHSVRLNSVADPHRGLAYVEGTGQFFQGGLTDGVRTGVDVNPARTGITLANTGEGTAIPNEQPSIAFNTWIKV